MEKTKIITLLTDFGSKDPYVAIMKGVIKSIAPSVEIIDLTHDISKFNVEEAAYILLSSYKYFPKSTIHVVVVDPGVGSEREPILIRTKNYKFIGPNNGVLTPAASEDGILEVRVLENEDLFLKPISTTFHGRDIFAPIAAQLSKGLNCKVVGKTLERERLKMLKSYIKPERVESKILGSIVYIDSFGNLITSIPTEMLEASYGCIVEVKIKSRKLKLPYYPSFSYVPKGKPLIYPGSLGRLEIGVNMGSASSKFKVEVGEKVELEVIRS